MVGLWIEGSLVQASSGEPSMLASSNSTFPQLNLQIAYYMSHVTRKPCAQLRLKPACSAEETKSLEILAIANRGIIY